MMKTLQYKITQYMDLIRCSVEMYKKYEEAQNEITTIGTIASPATSGCIRCTYTDIYRRDHTNIWEPLYGISFCPNFIKDEKVSDASQCLDCSMHSKKCAYKVALNQYEKAREARRNFNFFTKQVLK